jgi:protein-tyrosine phosphatase
MIDLHSHILPGIDDGARSLEQAVEMCRVAAAAGCEAMIATPHQRRGEWWNCDRATIELLRRRLQEAVGPEPRILSGGEIRVDAQLLAEILATNGRGHDAINADSAGNAGNAGTAGKAGGVDHGDDDGEGPLPLAGSRYLLLEFGSAASPPEAADLVHELSVAGWRPVLAHPELISWMAEDVAVVAHLVSLGAATQVTAMSVTGDFGRRAQADSHRLIELGLAHFVASDCHDLKRRPPGLAQAWKAIAASWGEEAARQLLLDNPRAVVADRPLPAYPAVGAAASAGLRLGR